MIIIDAVCEGVTYRYCNQGPFVARAGGTRFLGSCILHIRSLRRTLNAQRRLPRYAWSTPRPRKSKFCESSPFWFFRQRFGRQTQPGFADVGTMSAPITVRFTHRKLSGLMPQNGSFTQVAKFFTLGRRARNLGIGRSSHAAPPLRRYARWRTVR